MNKLRPYVFSAALLALAAAGLSRLLGPALAPGPAAIAAAFWDLGKSGELFREMAVTVWRALAGILAANLAGAALGLLAGSRSGALRLTAPLVAGLQSCPPVVWISLVMVWAGTGGLVPVATVFAAAFPLVFSTTAQGVMALDRRVLAMSRLYAVPRLRVFRRFILPGIMPYWLAGFSTVLAAGWKAAAVAEFLGSHRGIGARIYWSYSKLNMEDLYAWALALIILGTLLEGALITPLRRRAARMQSRGRVENA
ncbi:MAG: ABC transporter permease subunit [Candidatus Adiutrix sp.]|jgi:NitT/TauT family transport system permease protein|nr:ABC transporter permease subunit [Candidatus Adiutrix sp.]